MKVFITGAEGFVGRELVSQCVEKGIEVVSVDIVKGSGQTHAIADIRSKDIGNLIPEGVDAVIHLAGLTRDPDCKNKAYDCFDSNVMATLNLMDAAQEKNAKQFIFASSEWVYDNCTEEEKTEETIINIANHTSEYALSKLVSEANLRQKFNNGFCSVTALRFGIVYGSKENNWAAVESIFNTVKTKNEVEVGSLKTGRCFVHVKDIANGIIKSIGLSGFNIINLGADKFVTLGDVIETSQKVLGKSVAVKEKSPENISIRNISNVKAKNIIGWVPEISLEEGLTQLNEFLLDKGGD